MTARSLRFSIRAAQPEDGAAVTAMTAALARHDRLPRPSFDAEAFRRDGFGERRAFEALVAETPEQGLVGYALWFWVYDALEGRRGGYMEDLYVAPEARRAGVGRALMAAAARDIEAHGGRFLAWNAKTLNAEGNAFYAILGERGGDLVNWSCDGERFAMLAKQAE